MPWIAGEYLIGDKHSLPQDKHLQENLGKEMPRELADEVGI